MNISSKDNKLFKYLLKVFESKKIRDNDNVFIVEGYNLVEEAYKRNLIINTFSIKEEPLYKDSITISLELLKKLTNTVTPEGIIALVKKDINNELSNKILFLDRIQDPGNIGTLIRSAVSFGFNSIIFDETCDPFNPKVIRASEGAIFKINILNYDINHLKELGYKIYGTSMNGVSLELIDNCQTKIVIILGNEGNGVRKEYLNITNDNLTIPMINTESLNVGVAGSIIMYHFRKQ